MFFEGRYLHSLKVSTNSLIINYKGKTDIFTVEKLGEPQLTKGSKLTSPMMGQTDNMQLLLGRPKTYDLCSIPIKTT